MCTKCGILIGGVEITGVVQDGNETHLGCIRPVGHGGPHLIYNYSSEFVIWEDDSICSCDMCCSSESSDWCLVYGAVSEEEAKKFIYSDTYTGIE